MELTTFLRIQFFLAVWFENGLCTNNPQKPPRNLIMRLPTRTRDEIITFTRLQPASIYNHPIFQYPETFKEILSSYAKIYKQNIQNYITCHTCGLEANKTYVVRSDLIIPKIRVMEVNKHDIKAVMGNNFETGDVNSSVEEGLDLNDLGEPICDQFEEKSNKENCRCSKYEGIYNGQCSGTDKEVVARDNEKIENTNSSLCEVAEYSSLVELHVQLKDKLLQRIQKLTKDLAEWKPELSPDAAGQKYKECGYINRLRLIGLSLIDVGNFLLDDDPRKELCVIVGDEVDSDTRLYPPGCFRI